MPRESATRECPFCKEDVKAAAVRCRHCQAALVPTRPDHEGVCPFCKEEINVEAIRHTLRVRKRSSCMTARLESGLRSRSECAGSSSTGSATPGS
jgi:hypothetical protein